MRIVAVIARCLLGLAFIVFGLNGFLHFIKLPPPPAGSPAGEFFHATAVATRYMAFVFGVQVACGAALLAGLFVPLALVVIAPVIVNILLFHATMEPGGIGPGLAVAALWVVAAIGYRPALAPLLRPATRAA